MSVGRRLREVIQSKGMSLTDFSKRSGIQYRTLQDYVADKILPGSESLVKVHEELRVSLNWLLTGEGQVYLYQEGSEIGVIYEKLSESQQRLVLGIAQQLLLFKEMERRIMGG